MKLAPFESNFTSVVIRFYLMMAVVIIGGLTGQLWLMILGMVFFAFGILGVKFIFNEKPKAKVIDMKQESRQKKQTLNEAS